MVRLMLKYSLSWARILKFKLIYGKRFKFKLSGLKSLYIGKNTKIILKNMCTINFGENVYIDDYCRFECISGDITVGERTFFNRLCNIASLENISIGNDCLFGSNVGIYDHNHCYSNLSVPINRQGYNHKKINIENNIWIGANSVITKGVNICSNSVIGANSVVSKNVNKSGVYCGVPCEIIKEIN